MSNDPLDPNLVNVAAPLPPFPELTARERAVALLIADGHTNRDIAATLGVSLKTYDTHRGHVLKKLGLENTVQLTLLALRRGYVTP